MDRADIPLLSATSLGAAIESKQLSPVEAVEAYLERMTTQRTRRPQSQLIYHFVR